MEVSLMFAVVAVLVVAVGATWVVHAATHHKRRRSTARVERY